MITTSLEELLHYYRSADIQLRDDSCFLITPKLFSGEALSVTQQQMVDGLDEAIVTTPPLECDMILYRGCAPGEVLPNQAYPSFISTSLDLFEASGFSRGCLVRFRIAAGTRVLSVSPTNGATATLENKEYILPRNMTFEEEPWMLDNEENLKILFRGSDSARIAFRPVVG